MKHYFGQKIIGSKPMNLGDYNKYRGWDIPEDEDPNKEGYLVEYYGSGNKNHEKHDNYISWSPKEEFGKSYTCMEPDVLTFGMKKVEYGFNPSGRMDVMVLKMKYAMIIDDLHNSLEPGERSEKAKTVNMAIAQTEIACMLACC